MPPLVLDATTKKIQAKLSGAAATTNPDYVAAWADDTGTAFTEGGSDGALNGSTAVDVVAAPAASTRRIIKSLSIYNRDTAPVTLTIYYNNNGTQRVLYSGTLAVGEVYSLNISQGSPGPTGPAGPANTLYTETDGSTITFNIDTNGGLQTVVLGGNRTLAFTITTNRVFALILKQDATGTRVPTWPSGILWAGGVAPTLTTTANKEDCFVFIRTGSGAYIGMVSGQNI